MPVSVQKVVTRITGLVGLYQAGEAPAAEIQELIIDVLNGLLGSWSAQGWLNPKQFTASVASLKSPDRLVISPDPGPAVDIVSDPMNITQLTVELGSVVYTPNPISLAEYEQISVKTLQAPTRVWAYDWQQPQGTIWLYPRPLAGMTVRVVGVPRLSAAQSQSTLDLDDSWFEALVYNGAVAAYDYFPRDAGISPSLVRKAAETLRPFKVRASKMRAKRPVCAFTTHNAADSYWTSPLNTVTQ